MYWMTYMKCRLGEIRVWRKAEVNLDVLVSLQNTKDGVRQPSILVPREPAASRAYADSQQGLRLQALQRGHWEATRAPAGSQPAWGTMRVPHLNFSGPVPNSSNLRDPLQAWPRLSELPCKLPLPTPNAFCSIRSVLWFESFRHLLLLPWPFIHFPQEILCISNTVLECALHRAWTDRRENFKSNQKRQCTTKKLQLDSQKKITSNTSN